MKPKFNEIDHLFDDAFERAGNRQPRKDDIYNLGPMGADHELLTKSWNYFKERMRILENQWKEIAEAKDARIAALAKELDRLKIDSADLVSRLNDQATFAQSTKDVYLAAEMGEKRQLEDLQRRTEEERQTWITNQMRGDAEIKHLKEELLERQKTFEKREKEFFDILQQEKENALKQISTLSLKGKEALEMAQKKDDENRLQRADLDLMKSEVERKDGLVKQVYAEKEKGLEDLLRIQKSLQLETDKNLELTQSIGHLKQTVEAQKYEISILKSERARQEAEWRELWDRERGLWEQKKESD